MSDILVTPISLFKKFLDFTKISEDLKVVFIDVLRDLLNSETNKWDNIIQQIIEGK